MNAPIGFFGGITESFARDIADNLKAFSIVDELDINLYFDTTIPAKNSSSLKVLILMEPPAVMPENYARINLKRANMIISLSPWRARTMDKSFWSFQPIEFPSDFVDVSERRQNRVVIINDHKFGATRSSLYGYRRKLIQNLENQSVPLDLFGPNWSMSLALETRKRVASFRRALKNKKEISFFEAFSEFGATYKSYRGQAINKIKVMNSFRFALVVENDTDSLTEKIFDALYANCIVFYRGPNLKQFMDIDLPHIPLPENVHDAAALIQKYLKSDTRQLEDKIRAFSFESGEMKNFAEKTVARDIANHISRYVKAQEKML